LFFLPGESKGRHGFRDLNFRMNHFWHDLGRGLLYAVPVVAVAGLGVHEVIRLHGALHEAEARQLTAERALARLEERVADGSRNDHVLTARWRAAAEAAGTQGDQGDTDDRLTHVVEFLKQEVAAAETTIEALRRGQNGQATSPPGPQATTAELVREISRLNAEIESLRHAGSGATAREANGAPRRAKGE